MKSDKISLYMSSHLTYENIQKEAEAFAAIYRKSHKVPKLPGEKELLKYNKLLCMKYSHLIELVKNHVSHQNTWLAHDFDHLVYISVLSSYVSEKECEFRKITGLNNVNDIIHKAMLSGLLHDIERQRGFGEDHMIEGEQTAIRLLEKVGISVKIITETVRHHDHADFKPTQNILQIVYGSVFDADHFRYGLEREDTFWKMKEKIGVSPEDVIHDYKFLPPLRNAWKTHYGKEVGPKLIDFGLAVAKHIEKKFS